MHLDTYFKNKTVVDIDCRIYTVYLANEDEWDKFKKDNKCTKSYYIEKSFEFKEKSYDVVHTYSFVAGYDNLSLVMADLTVDRVREYSSRFNYNIFDNPYYKETNNDIVYILAKLKINKLYLLPSEEKDKYFYFKKPSDEIFNSIKSKVIKYWEEDINQDREVYRGKYMYIDFKYPKVSDSDIKVNLEKAKACENQYDNLMNIVTDIPWYDLKFFMAEKLNEEEISYVNHRIMGSIHYKEHTFKEPMPIGGY